MVYTSEISNIEFQVESQLIDINGDIKEYNCKYRGFVSNGTYRLSYNSFILFINDRLVSSNALKNLIYNIYSPYLPNKTIPFIYLSFTIPPNEIDVNIHPTKKEVKLLYETEIFQRISTVISDLIGSSVKQQIFPMHFSLSSRVFPFSTFRDQ